MKKSLKVRVLEKKDNYYLIERFYSSERILEYCVCIDYCFDSNTFKNGILLFDIVKSYMAFNTLVNDNSLDNFII